MLVLNLPLGMPRLFSRSFLVCTVPPALAVFFRRFLAFWTLWTKFSRLLDLLLRIVPFTVLEPVHALGFFSTRALGLRALRIWSDATFDSIPVFGSDPIFGSILVF